LRSDGRKVRWFFNDRFFPWLLAGAAGEMREKRFYTALHLMLLGAEILSGFSEGRSPDRESFCAFLERYVNRILRTRLRVPPPRRSLAEPEKGGRAQRRIAEILWDSLHRGFAEGCAAYAGGSLAEHSRYYYRCGRIMGLRLDVTRFHRDFEKGCRRFRADVYGDYLVRQMFIRRFDQIFETQRDRRRPRSASPREEGRGT